MNEPDDLVAQLLPGERVTWWGRPDPTLWLGPSDAYLIPFSVVWCGFAIFWEVTAIGASLRPTGGGDAAPVFFPVFGAAIALFGLYLLAGRFVFKALSKRNTIYAITDSRILVIGSKTVQEVARRRPLTTRSFRGRLNVTFTAPTRARNMRGAWPATRQFDAMYVNSGLDFFVRGTAPLAFYDVNDVGGLSNALSSLKP